jgi:phosphoglycolate phosphatase
VGDRKVCGTACYTTPTGTVVHASVLYDVNLEALEQAITPSADKLARHAVSSVRQRVRNLRNIRDLGDIENFRTMIEKEISNSKSKMAIFDLDGTLLNTIDDLGYACNHALVACGYPTHAIEEYPRLVGNGVNKLIERALPEGEKDEETVLRVRAHFVPYYDAHNCDYTRPYEGIPELLATLKARGYKLAVASNKYQAATEKIVTHFFPGIFDIILGERTGVPRKPDPQIVKDIMHSLTGEAGLSAQRSVSVAVCQPEGRSIYIGDTLVDRDTAANAGLPFIACSWGFVPREQLVEAGCTTIIDNPMELLNIL